MGENDKEFWILIILLGIIIGAMKLYYVVSRKKKGSDEGKAYYFDNNSTTLIYDKDVLAEISYWISCGNPSNVLHDFGKKARAQVESSRHRIARHLRVSPKEIYFTSGATESNNLLIKGVAEHYLEKDPKKVYRIITSSFEHPSVLKVCQFLAKNPRIKVTYLDPEARSADPDYGRIKVATVEAAIKASTEQVILITIMHGNNETGAVQDLAGIGGLARKYDLLFHTDATQTMGKYALRPRALGVNALSFSGHKFHGPKGVGGLYLNCSCSEIIQLCHGGEQEREFRPGTENVANIVGLSAALEKAHSDRETKNAILWAKTVGIVKALKTAGVKVRVLGPVTKEHRLPHTLLLLFPELGTCNKILVGELNARKIYVSVGSACQTSHSKSHVLDALQVSDKDKIKVIRISLSDYTTEEEITYLIKNLVELLGTK